MIIICGEKSWIKRASNIISEYTDIECRSINSMEIVNFHTIKKIVNKSDALVIDLDNVTYTMVEVATITQFFDIPVIGLCTDYSVPPRMVSLCDEIIDSNGEELVSTLNSYVRGF